MKKNIYYLILCFLFIAIDLNAKENDTIQVKTDLFSIGLGFGQDYGGSGFHTIFYPQRNIAIFAGLGYKLGGLGYNIGLKLRLVSKKPTTKVNPYAIVMYGYNAAFVAGDVLSADLHEYDKLFYGSTVGIGIDMKLHPKSKFYFSFGLNIPIRGSQVNGYIYDLKTNYGLDVRNDLLPVIFSIGVKYMILRK